MKKKLIAIFIIMLIILSVFTSQKTIKKENISIETQGKLNMLQIDQGDTFISISSNNTDGYNRGIPFYFQLHIGSEEGIDDDVESVEEYLENNFKNISLYSNNKSLFKTTELIWSAYKLNNNIYNLTLMLIPDLQEFIIDETTNIDKITFCTTKDNIEYKLSNYIIETRNTIDENDLYVAVSTIETELQDNLVARVNYGIKENNKTVSSLELDYPNNFANIESHKLNKIYSAENNTKEYSMDITFSAENEKVVFRPFIKILYSDNTSGWLIPTVPAYIK